MYLKISAIFLMNFLFVFSLHEETTKNWDLAVVIDDSIELLESNGSLIGTTIQQFSKLKALTFDNVRHQLVVSDMDQLNDTIFAVQFTKETDNNVVPIVQNLPDDVQGLTIDPITDTLFWTDSINRTISYLMLNDTKGTSNILLAFNEESPQDITVDICNRYIYWTNSNINKPTIERCQLSTNQPTREILINSDLHMPSGIAIDYRSNRLYWADMREGIYYRIESTNLDGKERELIYEGTHSKPFGLGVDETAIYWTDVNNNALWKMSKSGNSHPVKLRDFEKRPMGLIVRNTPITKLLDCVNLAETKKNFSNTTYQVLIPDTTKEFFIQCLNNGELQENYCKCKRGFTGKFCEISTCHNFCIHGNCYLSSLGYPQCHCPRNFSGTRCQINICDNFCLNNGICRQTANKTPKCSCRENFIGLRCETKSDIDHLCQVFCQQQENDYLVKNDELCSCGHDSYSIKSNASFSAALYSTQEFFSHFQDPAFLVLSCVLLILLVALIILSILTCSLKRRPRIKKRIIVNKNVTPLTYRPQQTSEHCEITIEDCCNMNVCETPCFEPPKMRNCLRNDDKKTLLSNMENGEELY